jgi:hypothetical protein
MRFFAKLGHWGFLRLGAACCLLSCAVGCSNELMNSAFFSDRARLEKFREYHDRQIGEPFYGDESTVCNQHDCSRRADGWLEIVHEGAFEEGCTIVWEVEPSPTGKYHHRNGMVFDIVGTRRAWRYVSDPGECLFGLDWEGPW